MPVDGSRREMQGALLGTASECGATEPYCSLPGAWEDSKAELRMLPSSLSLEFCLVGMELKIILELDCSCGLNSDEARR